MEEKWISLAGLKARGWTPKLIGRFLGEPERTVPNPHYRSAAPMRLWSLEAVLRAEQDPAFQEALVQAQRRKEAARKGALRRRELTLELARELPIEIERIPPDELLQIVQEDYFAYEGRWVEFKPWGKPDPLRDRLCVNYLRHQATEYDLHLETLQGKTGIAEAYLVLWERIMRAIEEAYPELRAEVRRQYRERKQRVMAKRKISGG
jgi:hypothetical protein